MRSRSGCQPAPVGNLMNQDIGEEALIDVCNLFAYHDECEGGASCVISRHSDRHRCRPLLTIALRSCWGFINHLVNIDPGGIPEVFGIIPTMIPSGSQRSDSSSRDFYGISAYKSFGFRDSENIFAAGSRRDVSLFTS